MWWHRQMRKNKNKNKNKTSKRKKTYYFADAKGCNVPTQLGDM